jgi:NAD(P)-dependent dehydrogenase (short-subunit alcohol dehydrogenase family)
MQANSPTSKLSGKIALNLSDLDVLFEAIRTKKGRLDILFANAGGGTSKAWSSLSRKPWTAE